MNYKSIFAISIVFIATAGSALAGSETDNHEIEQHQYIEKLDKISFLPSLLPVIIENSDVIELTDGQLQKMLDWRTTNREGVIASMNEVARKRVEMKEAALSPDVSSERLLQMQSDVFHLQRDVIKYKLSCRDMVIDTFNKNNWEGFMLVLAEKQIGVALPEMQEE